ncbi:unnamed protein product [Angiostrongylus costaricensis]|uniref:AN1-type domain-containing protein n=1 Tax=Angiostrongylus costaricensis TaxID=334426 RepID=A0A0R3PRJ2_ANGCS|nr:unnamed protein product [Angiostrongylus costaricensis]
MEHEITRNRMKAFFEPPETVVEMELRKNHFLLAPSNMEELNEVKARREALLKTVCKVCNGKLKPAEQQMPCACSYVFCKQHRKPDTHLCNIDHRQMGRRKISKVIIVTIVLLASSFVVYYVNATFTRID